MTSICTDDVFFNSALNSSPERRFLLFGHHLSKCPSQQTFHLSSHYNNNNNNNTHLIAFKSVTFRRWKSSSNQLSWYQKGKANLKQETVRGDGISLAICKSVPCSRQITTTTPSLSWATPHSFLQPGSKHWRLLPSHKYTELFQK